MENERYRTGGSNGKKNKLAYLTVITTKQGKLK